MSVPPRLILASASPRRLELLAQIGLIPAEVRPADIDETPGRSEAVGAYALRMAREKAAVVAGHDIGDAVILAADTVVSAGRRILGKPSDDDEAAASLRLLSGRRHRVLTAVAVRRGARAASKLVTSVVRFRVLSPREIDAYVASREWSGKAGGYAIQGRAAGFVPWIQGSFTGIVGLPLAETAALLAAVGLTSAEVAP